MFEQCNKKMTYAPYWIDLDQTRVEYSKWKKNKRCIKESYVFFKWEKIHLYADTQKINVKLKPSKKLYKNVTTSL